MAIVCQMLYLEGAPPVWSVVPVWVLELLGGCLGQVGGPLGELQLWVWGLQGEKEEVAGIVAAH